MTDTFVKIDGKDKYQDYWLNMRDASAENFRSDAHILIMMQEAHEKKIERIIKEKERLFELTTMLKSTVSTDSEVKGK